MNDFAEAFNDLREANDEASDKRQTAKVNGKTVWAIVEALTSEEVAVAGGQADNGGFRIQCAKKDLVQRPEKGDPIEALGVETQILEVIELNSTTYHITAGDLAQER